MAYKLTINGYSPPPVVKDGYSVTKNKIWSSNTGRSANGTMLGDIIARKYTVRAQWERMTQSQVTSLVNAIDSDAFFLVTFVNEKGIQETRTFYAADPNYPVRYYKYDEAVYGGISIELIEQ